MAASIADGIRASVEAAPVGTFIRSADVSGPRSAVNTALSRLAATGDLVRVRNGLYWKGVKSRFGAGRPGLLDAAIAIAGTDGAGPSGWSAAHALGLSTQLPAMPEVAVAGPVPSFAGVRFHKRNNLARRNLGFWEIALLEALRSYPTYAEVDLDELAIRALSLSNEGKVRFSSLETAALGEHSPTLRQNLAVMFARLSEGLKP
ncbi:MAG: DUF6088 family protein [Streptosporangiaceae bacterium]